MYTLLKNYNRYLVNWKPRINEAIEYVINCMHAKCVPVLYNTY